MRPAPSILHVDMDAFYASVEQAAKPSLAGRPVVVGGLGARGVVATASYEARRFGVRSAMPAGEARRRCPNAAFLVARFSLYRQVSDVVMGLLRELSPLVEPLSLDEAFVDLAAGPYGGPGLDTEQVTAIARRLRADILAATGLTASVGAATSKLMAKIASEADKPDGLVVVPPGTERERLDPLPVRALWGVGPATGEVLRKAGIVTVADLAATDEADLVRMLGQAHGRGLHAMALGLDDRPVVADRDAKSISVEDTFETDLVDRARIMAELDRLAARCVERLRASGRSGRTVQVKIRRYDFSTLTRSETLPAPTDEFAVVRDTARRLGAAVDVTGGLRLLGVGVSNLADFTQQDLFAHDEPAEHDERGEGGGPGEHDERGEGGGPGEGDRPWERGERMGHDGPGEPGTSAEPGTRGAPGTPGAPGAPGGPGAPGDPGKPGGPAVDGGSGPSRAGGRDAAPAGPAGASGTTGHAADAGAWAGPGRPPVFHPGRLSADRWWPGQDVTHAEHGPGWVQGSGVGRVTVRFEVPGGPPGRVRTFAVDDPALTRSDPLPLVPPGPPPGGRPGPG